MEALFVSAVRDPLVQCAVISCNVQHGCHSVCKQVSSIYLMGLIGKSINAEVCVIK